MPPLLVFFTACSLDFNPDSTFLLIHSLETSLINSSSNLEKASSIISFIRASEAVENTNVSSKSIYVSTRGSALVDSSIG